MRRNAIGETYCHTAAEAQALIDESGEDPYLPVYPPDPSEGDCGATIEIAASGDGDQICWIEAPTVEAVDAILRELKLVPALSSYLNRKRPMASLQTLLEKKAAEFKELMAENERLRSVLGVALSEHDDNDGVFAADYMPDHWTHEARRALEQKPST